MRRMDDELHRLQERLLWRLHIPLSHKHGDVAFERHILLAVRLTRVADLRGAGRSAEGRSVTRDDTGRVTRDREPVGLYDLRHSFVSIALASGMTLPEASALARHANPLITAKAYAGLTDDSRAKLGGKLAAAFA